MIVVFNTRRPRPGLLAHALRRFGVRPVYLHHSLISPEIVRDQSLVILGGPQSLCEAVDYDLLRFMRVLDRHIERGGTTFGICLGAQMIAQVAGARVRTHPQGLREIGYHQMLATRDHRAYDLNAGRYFAWHYDIIERHRMLTVTLSNSASEVQAFRLSDRVYGVQFHPEVDLSIIRAWQTLGAHRLIEQGAQGVGEQLTHHSSHHIRNRIAFDRFIGAFIRRAGSRTDIRPPARIPRSIPKRVHRVRRAGGP